ncbi:hypothetical protein DelCs14_1781 [Delftia sp. Cs1-4]|uniref:hypothetical protein n=1 Tax=Delftia sp. (strain Cs1-4) TaxID=742013 RepID=UPI00020E7BD8|nr:hypothetical protein [Delftia sp. Cs1-4]AEF88807.1 hypothetical protein DelCs14_1781 [Delftia sp. Cs1-4]
MKALSTIWTALCMLGHLALRAASVALVPPWLLRLLEIPSVFDRWLPGVSHWALLGSAAAAYAGSFLFLRLMTTKEEFRQMLEDR